jgi:hypothetical protein
MNVGKNNVDAGARLSIAGQFLCAGLLLTGACLSESGGSGTSVQCDVRKTREIPRVGATIELTGEGLDKPMVFTYERLARMEILRVENVLQQKTHYPDETSSWRGPSLDAMLAKAKMKSGPMSLVLEGADGFRIECTLEDMESAIIAMQDGSGRWLADLDMTRPFHLVPPRKPGNYWVRNLQRITVTPAADN